MKLAREYHVLPSAIVLDVPKNVCEERNANREAINHLQKGLKLVPQLENEQLQRKWELGLLRILAPTLQLSQGYANKAAGEIAERWLEVAKLSNHQQHTFDALTAQFTYFTFSGNLLTTTHYRRMISESGCTVFNASNVISKLVSITLPSFPLVYFRS